MELSPEAGGWWLVHGTDGGNESWKESTSRGAGGEEADSVFQST